MKKDLENFFEEAFSEDLELEFTKLVRFIDAAILQGCHAEGQEKTAILLNNFLNMRNYLLSELTIKRTNISIRDNVVEMFDNFVSEYDLDLDALEKEKREKSKKKESLLEDVQLSPELLSETDRSMSLKKEES